MVDQTNFFYTPQSANAKVFSFEGGDPTAYQNFKISDVGNGLETPGYANSQANQNYINELCSNKKPYPIQFTVFPNPFDDHFNLAFKLNRNRELSIHVYDVLGKRILRKEIRAQKGLNNHQLEFDQSISQGIYFLSVMDGEEVLYEEKVISIH